MRVLHAVLSGRMAGGQKVCLDLIREQIVRGHEVLLSSPSSGPIVETCPKGVRVFFHPVLRVSRPFVLVSLLRFLWIERPDLIHTHVTVSGNVLWRLAGRLAGVPVINHVHIGNYFRPESLSGRLVRWIDTLTARIPKRFIAVSGQTAAGLAAQGYPAGRIVIVPNGVDAASFSPRNGKSGRPRAVVGCIARLCRTKGQAVLLDAFARLDPGLGPAELWFVGEDQETGGTYRKVLEEQARDLGILDRVRFLGHRDDVAPLIGEMDLVVLPSFDEGMPLVLLEAMACAVPVVATRVGGVHELVDDGVDGTLVAPGDAADLANAVSRLLGDAGLRTRMGESGRKKAEERFALTKSIAAVRGVYEEVLARP